MDTRVAGALLREVARLHAQMQREQVACCQGTTSTQCQILTELSRSGPITLAELGRRLGLDKGWVSRAVETLAQEGLLTKQPGMTDHRTITIALSRAGEIRCQQLNDTLNAHAERVMGRIPPEQRQSISASLELLHQALQAEAVETAKINTCEEEPV
ncbi:MAG TPA: MarR family transcriptional regulator [Ktedonobacterales bacterium]|jgi:DNA-binding MarR family transcriptional regulator